MNQTTDMKRKEMDDIGRLIWHAGPREEVPADRQERSRAKVRDHWEKVVRERQAAAERFGLARLAQVAGLVTAAVIVIVMAGRWPSAGVAPVASVERINGELRIDGQPAGASGSILPGATLTTGENGRAALRLAGGQTLRIDTGSIVVLQAPERLVLDAGALYIDTGSVRGVPVRVETPFGTAQDIGTQFQVRLANLALVVSVRDGLVEVGHLGSLVRAVKAGYRVVFRDGSESGSEALDTDDQAWNWIETVVPEFDIDGASLADYLNWYAHEDGLELQWADDASRLRAQRTTLTGRIGNVSLQESLELVRRIAPFEYRHEGGRLWVRVK